jgi:hypothetical protein
MRRGGTGDCFSHTTDSRYLPGPMIVVTLAREFPAVPPLAVFRAVGKARRALERAGTQNSEADPDEIERITREELRRWLPARSPVSELQLRPKTGWRYGD